MHFRKRCDDYTLAAKPLSERSFALAYIHLHAETGLTGTLLEKPETPIIRFSQWLLPKL